VTEPVVQDGVVVRYFPSERLRSLYWSPPMEDALKREISSFDLLHIHSVFRWPTSMAAGVAHRKGVPYLLAPRGMMVKELLARKSWLVKSLWIEWKEKRSMERASAIHATSDLEAGDLRKFRFKWPPVHVVPNGVDLSLPGLPSWPAKLESALAGRPFILFIGRINWKKGLDRLIRALSHVPKASLVVVGNDEEGFEPRLEKIAGNAGVFDRVVFTGPLYGEDKEALLKRAALLALPSYSENFGNVALEAMAAGCPVVVTPEVGVADVVRTSGAGLVAAGDPEKLAWALNQLIGDPKSRDRMGEAGRRVVREKFTWERVALQMADVYRSVLKKS
ncbi:MAG: glycosyltransferase, partial [Candidatus Omnitrophica bacterium]|nr:glycosyltransferase [Candidatus Omnitrophota bacterium]